MAYAIEPLIEGGIPLRFDIEVFTPSPGTGYLAGEFPGGITTVGGAPVGATVRVLLRTVGGAPGDGAVVATAQSAADGTWRVDGLNLDLRYDVVGRKAGFNDVIQANVAPSGLQRIGAIGIAPSVNAGHEVIDASGAPDPDWLTVSALLHFDAVDGSTYFRDQKRHVFTAGGNAKISTTQSKWGSSSLALDGAGDFIYTPKSADFDIHATDFTISGWVYRSASGAQHYLCSNRQDTPTPGGYEWRINADNKLQFFYTAGTSLISAATVSSGSWVHLEITKTAGVVRQFINGALDANSAAFGSAPGASDSNFYIGSSYDGTGGFNGFIEDFRVAKSSHGTTSFTPPTGPYPNH